MTVIVWVPCEQREHAIVNLELFRAPAVVTAAAVTVLSGIADYFFLSVIVRFVQTPAASGYGFGSSVVVAGLVLMPWSALSLIVGRLVLPQIARRMNPAQTLAFASVLSIAGPLPFLVHRGDLWELVTGLAGLEIGVLFGPTSWLIISGVAANQTGSAMSVNQVPRIVAFAIGSAASAVVLSSFISLGEIVSEASGYDASAVLGIGIWLCAAVACIPLPRVLAPAPPGPEDVTMIRDAPVLER